MRDIKILTILFVCVLFVFNACVDPPEYPEEPVIEFVSISKTNVVSQFLQQEDSLAITISFTDGDGDLGNDDNSLDVMLIGSNFNDTSYFKLPVIPQQGVGNGISGEATFSMDENYFCCLSCFAPVDETNAQFYTIRIKDIAGNFSNPVVTPEITIQCQ